MGRNYNINPGDIYGRLIVIGKVEDSINQKSKKHESQYLCRCSCKEHNTVVVKGKNLVNGHTQSCGCIRKELAKFLHTKKYEEEQLEYPNIYPNVISAYYRMINESKFGNDQNNHSCIPIYGSWMPSIQYNNIKSFYDCMSTTYEPGYKIGRIDKTIGFRPDNCLWVTNTQSNRDKINDRFIEYNNDIFTVSEWNRALGYKPNTIMNRLVNGYNDIEAIIGKPSDIVPINAIYFVNEFGRPLNNQAIKELDN